METRERNGVGEEEGEGGVVRMPIETTAWQGHFMYLMLHI